jgi:hypothetical protein
MIQKRKIGEQTGINNYIGEATTGNEVLTSLQYMAKRRLCFSHNYRIKENKKNTKYNLLQRTNMAI